MNLDIITRRLSAQGLAEPRFETAAEAVGWLGAVQSQDYPGAKWALAQRMAGITDVELDRELDAGEILRTHVMRSTWHFVLPQDIRWMLALSGPRVLQATRSYYHRFGLEGDELQRAAKVIEQALRGGHSLTRAELAERLEREGFDMVENLRMTFLVGWAEQTGLIVSGPLRGSPGGSSTRVNRGGQQTYALLDERVPAAPLLTREESLAELAWRFFRSHGPASIKDFVWWSGLTQADARLGIAANGSKLSEETFDGVSLWSGTDRPSARRLDSRAHLLPNYDEFIVAYADRRGIIDDKDLHRLDPRGNVLFSHTVLIDGRVAGTWKRTFKKGAALVEMKMLRPPSPEESAAIDAALARYGEFLGMRVEVVEG